MGTCYLTLRLLPQSNTATDACLKTLSSVCLKGLDASPTIWLLPSVLDDLARQDLIH